MNKIILKDATQYNIKETSTENEIIVVLENMDTVIDVYNSFTDLNLSEYKILNDSDSITSIYSNKQLASATIEEVEDGVEVTMKLKDIDETLLRIAELESKVAELEGAVTKR